MAKQIHFKLTLRREITVILDKDDGDLIEAVKGTLSDPEDAEELAEAMDDHAVLHDAFIELVDDDFNIVDENMTIMDFEVNVTEE